MKTASRLKMAASMAAVVRASVRPGAPSLPERVQAVPRLVRSTLQGTYAGTTLKRLGLVAGAVAYVASPVDLLPEAVLPVLGAADDAVVISWAIKAFFEETDRFLSWEAGHGSSDARSRRDQGAGGRFTGSSEASRTTVPGSAVPGSAVPASAGNGDTVHPSTHPSTGVPRDPQSVVATSGARSAHAPNPDRDVTGAAAGPDRGARARLPEGVRQAAADFVLESMRRRLER